MPDASYREMERGILGAIWTSDESFETLRIEEFPMAGWERGSAALRLTAPVSRDFSCVAMPYCPAADLDAELLDVGEGEKADFERLAEQVPGKIVISAAET